MGAIGRHKTSTSTSSWDGPANKTRLGDSPASLKAANAWVDPSGDSSTKAAYKFIHHEVSGDGNVGAANLTACSTGIAILNGGRGGTNVPASDKRGIYNHLAGHLRDAGREPPELQLGGDMGEFTYWSDLSTYEFTNGSDEVERGWVHSLSVGPVNHPIYGTINLTMERIQRFATNLKNKILGIDAHVNYDHREKDGRAAGWVKDAEVRSDGLWLFVEWTKEAAEKIRNREYRYISAEFRDEWENPHDGKKYKDVLRGAALTNLPFLKNLVPVNLSELAVREGEDVDRKELAVLLGLPEDASEEDIKKKAGELVKAGGSQKLDLSKLSFERQDDGTVLIKHPEGEGEAKYKPEPVPTGGEEELAKLAESNPAIAKMLSEHKAMKDEFGVLKTAHRLSEIDVQLSELDTDKRALPPVFTEKLRPLLARLPKQLSDDFVEAVKELHKVGFVELGERKQRVPSSSADGGDAVKRFTDAVDKKRQSDDKLSYRDAVAAVVAEDPDMYREYEDAINSGTVVLQED